MLRQLYIGPEPLGLAACTWTSSETAELEVTAAVVATVFVINVDTTCTSSSATADMVEKVSTIVVVGEEAVDVVTDC